MANRKEKLTKLRNQMKKLDLDAYIQPLQDCFMSEYPPACYKRIEWLCGFSGSAGTLIITANDAVLFTDGRYTIQANQQLDGSLYSSFNITDKRPEDWLADLSADTTVGYDADLFTPAELKRIQTKLTTKDITLQATANPIDAIWDDQPAPPATPVFLHDESYAGASAKEKCGFIAREIKEQKQDALLIAAPDAICWLLNIRAHDVECTPLALCRAILHADGQVDLFFDKARLPDLPDFITPYPLASLADRLAALQGKHIRVDETQATQALLDACRHAGLIIQTAPDPIQYHKAVKNAVQLEAIRQAHIMDGVAVTQLLYWLDSHPDITSVSEIEIDEKLLALRKQNKDFVEPSFPTIAGSGPHGAIIHYRADEISNQRLQQNELLLIDSGGQYLGGTTDITRTIAIGTPTPEQKRNNTLVLKGHIALASATFPTGTRGSQLDALARQFLWKDGLDYDHGTGHGVGQFLGVHEGPQRISKRGGDAVLKPGMILSNEPGYYKEGAYGIRIENLMVVVEKSSGVLGFETLTCAPMDCRLMDEALLTAEEKNWIHHYHSWVNKTLSPHLPADVKAWLSA